MSAREQETSEDIETVHADMHGNEAIRYTSCMALVQNDRYFPNFPMCAELTKF